MDSELRQKLDAITEPYDPLRDLGRYPFIVNTAGFAIAVLLVFAAIFSIPLLLAQLIL